MLPAAKKLLNQADKMDKQISRLLNPAIGKQKHTPRRAQIAAGMFEEGEKLAKLQRTLRNFANAMNENRLPVSLKKIERADQIGMLLDERTTWQSAPELFTDLGLWSQTNVESAKYDLEQIAGEDPTLAAKKIAAENKNKELSLIGEIPGYFPTPRTVAARLIEIAESIAGPISWVFDPSCGGGAILDAVRDLCPGAYPSGNEIDQTLYEIAKGKGHKVTHGDALKIKGKHSLILCNPPFESSQDIDHVMYYYHNLLADGGILVSVVGAGAMHNHINKAQLFQRFVEENGEWEKLPEGSFAESKTGVHTCVVVLRK